MKLFFKKNAKFSSAGGFAPRPPLASGCSGLRPQTPKTALPLRISGYAPGYTSLFPMPSIKTFGSSLSFFAKSWLRAKPSPGLLIIHFMICPRKSLFFRKIFMTPLHVICGLGPQSKILATPMLKARY